MKSRWKWLIPGILLFTLLLQLASCKEKKGGKDTSLFKRKLPEPEQWALAQKEGTISAYESYLKAYRSGPHETEALQALRELWDQKLKKMSDQELEQVTAILQTSQGAIKIKFFPAEAPITVRNFIKLAQSHFYDGLIFHRVIDGYLIQTGCPRGDGMGGPGYTIPAEFNDHPHLEGTVAMARGLNPNSGGSQFYICLSPQPRLDNYYTVFGQVTEGMEVVKAIGKLPTDAKDRPLSPPVIQGITFEGLEKKEP